MFVTRLGYLVFAMKRLLTTFLGNSGQRFIAHYLAFSRGFADRELVRIAEHGVGEPDFYGLMSIYPGLQRVLFIHIPKCGGTSFRRMLVREGECAPVPTPESGTVDQAINFMIWSAPRRKVQRRFLNTCVTQAESANLRQKFLRVFASYYVAQSPKRIFILGHLSASELIPYFRNERDLFLATVRAPAGILKSLVSYRVTQTLEDNLRPDAIQLLNLLKIEIQEFTELARLQPRRLTESILERQTPLLTTSLAFDHKKDCESVWKGIKEKNVFLAHLSEQALMAARLFGSQPSLQLENASADRAGLAAQFTASIREDWTEPFVDDQSRMLYQRLESTGIIGFWRGGGTVRQYRDLLRNA